MGGGGGQRGCMHVCEGVNMHVCVSGGGRGDGVGGWRGGAEGLYACVCLGGGGGGME